MAPVRLLVAFGLIATPLGAQPMPPAGAPQAPPGARYCMHIEANTGTRVEKVECWTREEWWWQGVDVDLDWAKNGVAVQA